jgi:hypothetical protein
MITSWDIYWITRLDAINTTFCVTWAIILIVALFSPLIYITLDDMSGNKKVFWKGVKISVVVFLVAIMMQVFTPSTKEFAAIYLIPKIANNEQVQRVPDNFVKLLNSKMEEWIKSSIQTKEDK